MTHPAVAHEPAGRGSALRVRGLSKSYRIWTGPSARLWTGPAERAARSPLLPALLRARLARLARAGFRDVEALREVSFEVEPGESVGVIGRNGSGKSTLLQIVAGVVTPSGGSVERSGRVAALLELGTAFNPEFTGRENARLNGLVLGVGSDELEAKLPEILDFADIGEFIDHPVRTYSTGMLMRLAFAVSVAVEPDLLIVDEVLAVGDLGFQFKCLERLRSLIDGGTTVLLVSHDPVIVKSFCRKALYLYRGERRGFGPTEEITERYFLDVRDDQRRDAGAAGSVTPRPSLRDAGLLSFGTSEGRILEASLGAAGSASARVASGEVVEVAVQLEVSSALAQPHLTLAVLNDRMVPLGGLRTPVRREPGSPERTRHAIRCRLRAAFTPGCYFVTLRLEDGASAASALLVEKQTGVLQIEVLETGDGNAVGYVDLAAEARQWQVPRPRGGGAAGAAPVRGAFSRRR